MPGFRISHATERSCRLLVPSPAKTSLGRDVLIPLDLDETGAVIVSQGVLEDLARARGLGATCVDFQVLDVVENPPKLSLVPRGPQELRRERIAGPTAITDHVPAPRRAS